MNCKNVEPLLPLYVGRDLEEERSRMVAAHLQSCTECTLAADEYAGARKLLQAYEAPFFGDEVYARVRGQVLNQIQRETHARWSSGIFSQLLLPLVQPRMRWVTAALLLAISVTALYFSRSHAPQVPNDKQVAVRTVESNQSGIDKSVVLFSGKPQIHVALKRHSVTSKRKANAGVVATNLSRVVQRVVGVSQQSSAPAPLRLEIQTNDRNIRIIWLSAQDPGAGRTDGSKGL